MIARLTSGIVGGWTGMLWFVTAVEAVSRSVTGGVLSVSAVLTRHNAIAIVTVECVLQRDLDAFAW